MNLHSFRLTNFRRLKDVHIELDHDISIFVGANNSGKTSATQAIQMFLAGEKQKFSIHDFSSDCWSIFNLLGADPASPENSPFPTIALDLWFNVQASDLYRVVDLLPNLKWTGSQVGIRVEFAPKNAVELLANFSGEKSKAQAYARTNQQAATDYHPWPISLTDYLSSRLRDEYDFRYYILDRAAFDADFKQNEGYSPAQLTADKERGGPQKILNSLIRVDGLNAQRHLSDAASGARAEDLSKCLSRFYNRNLQQRDDDYDALRALATSESQLNDHLARVFQPTLEKLSELGYPGFSNPRLIIKSALRPTNILSQDAKVHYALGDSDKDDETITLPDSYNGLGFKNLIYMVVELLDLHARWMEAEEDRPPLHLIFIEEPEAHLHAQLQQVFIRKVLDILRTDETDAKVFNSQLVVTTHSPHILYERGFTPIRYFKRSLAAGPEQQSEVRNLSTFYGKSEDETREFLQRYMKLTHGDLFFADAAILVEGNVERLLLPLMIEQIAPQLNSRYLSILEVGGAFAHRFRELIEFLGITALVITDIDSMLPKLAATTASEDTEDEDDEDDSKGSKKSKGCPVNTPNAVTSNQTLIGWLPKKTKIADLLSATPEERTQEGSNESPSTVRVTYQTKQKISWNGENKDLAGRTLEEAFALENLSWCQDEARKHLGLRVITKKSSLSLDEIAEKIFNRVNSSGFNKTNFALGVMTEEPKDWKIPAYIAEGLEWLSAQVAVEAPTGASDEEETPAKAA